MTHFYGSRYNPPALKIQRALLSVFDKTGIVDFARRLRECDIEILSTGGTAKTLRDAGISIQEVSSYTGFPEIMDGRVKTLHPKVHGGILAVRDDQRHADEAERQGIALIDLVAVTLYPFQKVIAHEGVSLEDAIESIDVGGPAMIRAAAKNHKYVTVLTDPADYPRAVEEIHRRDGQTSEMFRRELAVKAFAGTARYDTVIANYLGGRGGEFPFLMTLSYEKVDDLRYGENPHQRAAYYRTPAREGCSVALSKVLGGKGLSYNNVLDLESAFELVRELRPMAAAIVKHNNPCGVGIGTSSREAFQKALEGDPVSAYGGILAFNRGVDGDTAEAIVEPNNFFEATVAPEYDAKALDILRHRPKWGKNLRILEAGSGGFQDDDGSIRGITGGLLVQTPDRLLHQEWRSVTIEGSPQDREDLLFAWTVCKHVKSNAIVLTREGKVVGVGAGQMSRLDAAKIALDKAGDRARGSVAASDAFFPFPDALERLLEAGIRAAVMPGGSIRDEEVIACARRRGVPLVITGTRHFRH